ncbi:hypothetical protein C8F01DRAFT_1138055 [Mycena amicta]|nr:hypothetical protein C8F01DRAFT_1138055 [Mycena amicta]
MKASDRVPPEIWSETFAHLPNHALQAISLAARDFALLARPFLFSSFNFHPYAPGRVHGAYRLLLPSPEKIQRYLERLHFWLSDDIAPLVRSCAVTPWHSYNTAAGPFVESDNTDMLLDVLVASFHMFSRLRKVQFSRISLPRALYLKLWQMSNLREMEIKDCPMDDFDHLLLPSNEGPKLSHLSVSGDLHKVTMKNWVPFGNPRHLQNLCVGCDLHSWTENPHLVPIFPAVTHLSIDLVEDLDLFCGILHKFPAVETLDIFAVFFNDELLHQVASGCRTFIGSLKRLMTSADALPIFLPRATALSELVIDPTYGCPPQRLIECLPPGHFPTITYLSVDLYGAVDSSTLSTILQPFPSLHELKVVIVHGIRDPNPDMDHNLQASTFFHGIVDNGVLPEGITSLMLTLDLTSAKTNLEPTLVDVPRLRDSFLAKHPSLISLWLDGEEFLLIWRRDLDGYVDECITFDAEEMDHLRNTRGAYEVSLLD